MFEYMKGIAAEILLDKIIIEVNGIGYRINSSLNSTAEVKKGEMITVYTYLAVKEDEVSLYGFVSRDELMFFKQLLSVSKVGPKVATAILSTYSPKKLSTLILSSDFTAISKAPGVGKKTAERIVLELKDKVEGIGVMDENPLADSMMLNTNQEAIEALITLGYTRLEAEKALNAVAEENASTEELIKKALRWLVK